MPGICGCAVCAVGYNDRFDGSGKKVCDAVLDSDGPCVTLKEPPRTDCYIDQRQESFHARLRSADVEEYVSTRALHRLGGIYRRERGRPVGVTQTGTVNGASLTRPPETGQYRLRKMR